MLVANSAYTHTKLVCPLLDKNQGDVGFTGNYRRHHGRGYVLREWLRRLGYEMPKLGDTPGVLADMAVLAEKFDLVVVGRHLASSRWYTLPEIWPRPAANHLRLQGAPRDDGQGLRPRGLPDAVTLPLREVAGVLLDTRGRLPVSHRAGRRQPDHHQRRAVAGVDEGARRDPSRTRPAGRDATADDQREHAPHLLVLQVRRNKINAAIRSWA